MPKENDIVIKASEFVSVLFRERLAEYLVYHTYQHSEMVAQTARKISKGMKLGDEGIEVVTLAGWLHDTGYTEVYRGHEEISIRIATEFLRAENYPEEKIKLVTGCIRATKIPQKPNNILEEIVADADLSGLGRKSFFAQGEMLHIEWKEALGITHTDEEWAQQNLELLTGHRFFTSYAREKYDEKQGANIRATYKTIRKLAAKEEEIFEEQTEEEDLNLNTDWDSIFKSQNDVDPLPAYDTLQTSSGNDKKAQMMMIANIVILAAGILSLFIFIDRGLPRIIIMAPIMLLIVISMITVVFSILSVRPVIPASKQTSDPPLLQQRSRYLQFSYNFFLYGIPVCVVLFIILFLLRRVI